jgi:hypothetical protein
MSDERRQAQRYRTLKGAHIVFNRGGSSINCVVRNLSETGALLKVGSPFGIPNEFVLALDNGPATACRVVRRTASEIAVEFVPEDEAVDRHTSLRRQQPDARSWLPTPRRAV